ncbi:phasin family protein [Bradyrhizobium frederickii]|uniref:phasin family protein n=1 Tax=Bradyrhizobium frederickii TaxID=2560054 RepID=UPI001F40262B|nr:phasin family protein [Bradyrhizobium frederickii]
MEIAASPPVAPVDPLEASTQAIADAYSDYIRTSLEQAWSFLGKLATARSPVEAFELQMAYAKQACDSFVAESQKITELHEQLADKGSCILRGSWPGSPRRRSKSARYVTNGNCVLRRRGAGRSGMGNILAKPIIR